MNRQYTDALDDFAAHIGILCEDTDWDEIGIQPTEESGAFDPSRLKELKAFIKAHPDFCIVTLCEDAGILYYAPQLRQVDAVAYYLAPAMT